MLMALDTEDTGIDLRLGARCFFITICKDTGDILSYEWHVDPLTRMPDIPESDIREIRDVIESADSIVCQNGKFDATALEVSGILQDWPWHKTYDTLIAGHLLSSNTPHNLTDMGIQYLGRNIEKYELLLKDATQKARRLCRSHLNDWRIAAQDLPEMPSATKEPWKADTWLPKAICGYACTQMLTYDERNYKKKRDGTIVQPWWYEYGWEYHPWQTVLSNYANKDSETTLLLWYEMEKELHRRHLWKIFQERMRVIPVAVAIERRGITVSGERLERLQCEFSQECARCEVECVNIASTYGYTLTLPKGGGNNKSLTEFCFKPDPAVTYQEVSAGVTEAVYATATDGVCLNLKPVKRGKPSERYRIGTPSLDKETIDYYLSFLEEDSNESRFIKSLASKRKRETAIGYMNGYKRYWTEIEDENWYRMYPSLNPTGSDTLRWSHTNPNSANISKQEGFNLRYAFGPAPGREWWSLDAKNIELRIPAYEAGETDLIYVFEHPNDAPYYGSYHLVVFDLLHPDLFAQHGKKCKDEFESTWYQWVKNGNFAVIYGCQEEKADATFVEPYLAEIFNRNSLVKLVPVSDKPVRVYGNTFVFLKDDQSLKEVFDTEIKFMKTDGTIERLLQKYEFV